MTELSVPRPLDEPDLDDDVGTDPMAVTGQARALRERRLLDRQSVETCSQIEQQPGVEASADLAGEHEVVTVLRLVLRTPRAWLRGVVTDEERAESDACALGVREPADHELLRRFDLHLQPVLRSAMLVRRTAALGDDAFPAFAACAIPRLGIVDEIDAQHRRLEGERVQQRTTFFDRLRGDIAAVNPEDVEDVIAAVTVPRQ